MGRLGTALALGRLGTALALVRLGCALAELLRRRSAFAFAAGSGSVSELELEVACSSDSDSESLTVGAVLNVLRLGLAAGSSSEDDALVEGQSGAMGCPGPPSSEPNSSEGSPQSGMSAPQYNIAISLKDYYRTGLNYINTLLYII